MSETLGISDGIGAKNHFFSGHDGMGQGWKKVAAKVQCTQCQMFKIKLIRKEVKMATEFRTKELSVRFARNCIMLTVPYYIEAQLKKTACSVPQNLSEGAARHTVKDRHKFYRIALGSFREVEILIEILEIKNQELTLLQKQLGGSLVNLCKATE